MREIGIVGRASFSCLWKVSDKVSWTAPPRANPTFEMRFALSGQRLLLRLEWPSGQRLCFIRIHERSRSRELQSAHALNVLWGCCLEFGLGEADLSLQAKAPTER